MAQPGFWTLSWVSASPSLAFVPQGLETGAGKDEFNLAHPCCLGVVFSILWGLKIKGGKVRPETAANTKEPGEESQEKDEN